MRSKLFVPGIRPELFAKALASEADGLSFDLEDSVPEEAKARAREHRSALLDSAELRASRKCMVVRINPIDSA
jgi:citrate lyase subunit beta/citryl-CoA lyase